MTSSSIARGFIVNTDFTVVSVDFETVLPIWQTEIWPGRVTPIKPMAPMTYLGGYDMDIPNLYQPTFFAIFDDTARVIGTTSGYQTSADHYRCRTMYVNPEFRRRGLALALVQAVEQGAIQAGCDLVWGLPRVSPMVAMFEKCGWMQVSDPITEGMEFGPNVYMMKDGLRPKKTRKRRSRKIV
jgi:GNAT superfamily N-acetyltransferase